MNATASPSPSSTPAAGGGRDHVSPCFANANLNPRSVHVGVLSGGRDMSVAGLLRISAEALESKAVVAAWAEFREELHADPALNIRRGDMLRARKLAAGQGRPRVASVRRGPNKAEQWAYRQVLRRGLGVIAGLPGTTVGTAVGRGMSVTDTASSLLARLSSRRTADGTPAPAIIRTNTPTSSWYELTPAPTPAAPSLVEGLPYASAELEGLLEAAEFVAYCAYQHHARRHNRRFLWEWFPELLPGAEGPMEL